MTFSISGLRFELGAATAFEASKRHSQILLLLLLTAGVAGTALTHAAAAKNDAATEAREAAQEDADEASLTNMAEQLRKYQHEFHGTFLLPSDPSQKTSAAVVGTFVTDDKDRNPNQTYLLKVADGNKKLLETLKRFDMKKVTVQGKLRNQGKYLIATAVSEPAAGQPVQERRSGGGI